MINDDVNDEWKGGGGINISFNYKSLKFAKTGTNE